MTSNQGNTGRPEWRVIIDTLRITNRAQYDRICQKLLYILYRKCIEGTHKLIKQFNIAEKRIGFENGIGENYPLPKTRSFSLNQIRNETITLAHRFLEKSELLGYILGWIKEDRVSFLTTALEEPSTSFSKIVSTLDRYFNLPKYERHLTHEQYKGLRVSLIQRFLSDSSEFARVACDFLTVRNFHELLPRMIGTTTGTGKTGGKGAGMFFAHRIIEKAKKEYPILANVKVPNTWYLLSDVITDFIHYNSLEEVINFKYREIDEIKQEFQYFEQMFKNAQFKRYILTDLTHALRDIGNRPVIIRSSSLLEDSFEASFAGKYKSLFLANTGDNHSKLVDLKDAIAEVYASVLNPDAIVYRKKMGLIYFREEMGCLIQEVVGKRVGKYFFPAFAGVAFSNNEIRWSSRIKREDGVVRMVAGLGTRAVDRVAGDYPTLVSPGRPNIKVNNIPSEIVEYSQKYIDVINLESSKFETKELTSLLQEVGDEYPILHQIASVYENNLLNDISPMTDHTNADHIITFKGLFEKTPFLKQIETILAILKKSFQTPVDVEFAFDGEDLYILQCRPQYSGVITSNIKIPSDISEKKILFTADKYVSQGLCSGITHIIYIDPLDYGKLESREQMLEVGNIVSRLNSLLPEKSFILMGPGRWGSRGDIKLGVSITYAGISNTAALIEIARSNKSGVPDVSFGTHFFLDIVESGILYLPLYPDEKDQIFNSDFLRNTDNSLTDFLPDAGEFMETVRVLNISKIADGKTVKLVMSADENRAVAFLEREEKRY